MSKRATFSALLGLVLAGVVAIYAIVSGRDNGPAASAPPRDPYKYLVWHETPEPLPAQSFVGPKGETLTLADFKGKTVLLNLWASWCAPCVKEMPALSRLERDLGGSDFMVLSVSLDHNPEEGQAWLSQNGIANLVFHHDPGGKLYDALKAAGLPLSVFIDKAGAEVGRVAGDVPWDDAKARALIAKAGGPGADKAGGS